jgi:hypothetical protein
VGRDIWQPSDGFHETEYLKGIIRTEPINVVDNDQELLLLIT